MKVYEVMEQYKDYKFLIYRTVSDFLTYSSDSDCIFKGYRAVCKSWCLNMWVYDFAELSLSNRTVVIILY